MDKDYVPPHRRGYVCIIVETSATVVNDEIKTPAIINDLSPRGAGIFSNYPFKENDEVEIIINSLFGDTVSRKAKVKWSKKVNDGFWHTGLDFGQDNLVELKDRKNTPKKT